MSRARRQARRQARKTKRTERRAVRKERRAVRKEARQQRRASGKRPPFLPPLPGMRRRKKGLADLTNAPGMKEQAGGPSLNEIATAGEPQEAPIMATPPIPGGLAEIQDTGGFPPELEAVEPWMEEQAGDPVIEEIPADVELTDEPAEEESSIIGELGKAVGGILGGLNINSGKRREAKAKAQLDAYNARMAAEAAAKPKQSNTPGYIALGIGLVVLVVVIVVVMKKRRR